MELSEAQYKELRKKLFEINLLDITNFSEKRVGHLYFEIIKLQRPSVLINFNLNPRLINSFM